VRVGVVGVGHVGLPTAAVLAHIGHEVVAMDNDTSKIEALQAGKMPFFEAGMSELVEQMVDAGRLRFTDSAAETAEGAAAAFLCVGTPPKSSGEANLLAVERAAEAMVTAATGDLVLVEKSTVPAGTAQQLTIALRRHRTKHHFWVVSNPEFLQEGRAIEDSLRPHRVLVGSSSPEALAIMEELYRPLIEAGAQWIATDVATAELAKHASNAFLSMKISFANALARLCELSGADVIQVVRAMGSDPRIGTEFLNAGLGYGGYCFPKDLAAFERLADRFGYDFGLLREVKKINDEAVESVFKKIEEAMWNLQEKRIALLGLSFKPGTDDTRLSPALRLAELLLEHGAHVVGYDPKANVNAQREVPGLEIADDVYGALQEARCAVICTEWPEFAELDLDKAADLMAFPILIDGRNLMDPDAMDEAGFTYIPTGRPPRGVGPHSA
jgi:UDPglucose 6-dehydrogenase